MSEEAVLIENTESDFKQGRARKVNVDNFYLICDYLRRNEEKLGAFCWVIDSDSSLKTHEEVMLFLVTAPKERTSKVYVEKATYESKAQIIELKERIELEHFSPFYHNKEKCEESIAIAQKRLQGLSYIELTEAMLYELHSLLVQMESFAYKAMVSWVKQKRFRDKKITHQVTLSERGKKALESLKVKLKANNFNDVLIELDKRY